MFKARPLASLLAQTLASSSQTGATAAILFTASGALLAQASHEGGPAKARVMAALAAGIWSHRQSRSSSAVDVTATGEPEVDEGQEHKQEDPDAAIEVALEHGQLILQPIETQRELGFSEGDRLLVALQGDPAASMAMLRQRALAVKVYIEEEAAQVAAQTPELQ
ncbi:hypothetical protein BCR37DRAFT_394887 [Protomyces lactucae-debilis]|uniref:Roadblock/LAMTOR2 domain-containing protein n=1 Tax=Protomyces lactucae-debilis TaxID=2754530 RepID=A0A1Y2F1P4_PROLT|nr:uncharacterized protein BCR37DRAFT_394887 [Protomyces lactucae-debilis]ORY77801.1 hypothetical protein BCR37DRAFT_394887 [Protomyces lactucae-debilis]